MITTHTISFIDGAVSADSISKTIRLESKTKGLIIEVNGTGQFSVRIEASPNGTDWYGINELDPFSADSMQSLSSNINIFRNLRAKIDIGTSGSVTVCKLHYSKE